MLKLIRAFLKPFHPDHTIGSQAETLHVTPLQQKEEEVAPLDNIPDLGLLDAALSGWYQHDTNEIFRGIPIHSHDVVVDIGCGDGRNSLFCANRGARVIAFDIDPHAVQTTRARLQKEAKGSFEVQVSHADSLPLPDGIASRILCTEVLEHVDDPDRVLSELFRIGQPGALYLLTAPDPQVEHLQKRIAPPLYFQKPNHVRIIERPDFVAMAERAGLIVEERTQHGFYWSIWWTLFWSCGVDLAKPDHPVLNHWTETWRALLSTQQGTQLKKELDAFLPKSQAIIARKP